MGQVVLCRILIMPGLATSSGQWYIQDATNECMRFWIFGGFAVFWFAMWWYVYTCHIKECCATPNGVTTVGLMEEEVPFSGVLSFDQGSITPLVGDRLAVYRDSLMALLTTGRKLIVTGYYTSAESETVARQRVRNTLDLIAPSLDTSRVLMNTRLVDYLLSSQRGLIGVDLRVINEEVVVQELDDRVVIYFPFNSTLRLEDPEIDTYLESLAEHLRKSTDSMLIEGHSDAFGPASENYQLGLWRAEAIRDQLIERGVSPEVITVVSRGETEPIGDNRFKEGAKLNRRVELKLLKSR